jgi:hypothetical protein
MNLYHKALSNLPGNFLSDKPCAGMTNVYSRELFLKKRQKKDLGVKDPPRKSVFIHYLLTTFSQSVENFSIP